MFINQAKPLWSFHHSGIGGGIRTDTSTGRSNDPNSWFWSLHHSGIGGGIRPETSTGQSNDPNSWLWSLLLLGLGLCFMVG